MRLLGIDLGIHKVGVAVLGGEPFGLQHAVAYESVATERDVQLAELMGAVHGIALLHEADSVWVEDVLVGNNHKYSLALAETKGAVLAGLAQLRLARGTDVRTVPVGTWKREVVGSGNATKERVQNYIRETHPAYAPLCGDDQDLYDASCVGLYGHLVLERASQLTL
jgi:Holliday junction resolvasome RuvABC endonuclease subunit